MSLRIRYLLEYIPFFLFVKIFSLLPLGMGLKAGKSLGRLIYYLDAKHRRIAVNNISAALGLGKPEADQIAVRVFENLGYTFAEFIKLPNLDKDYFEKNVTVEGFENYKKAKENGAGVIILSAHFGNWEFLPASHLIKMGETAGIVYKVTKNPYVDKFIDSIRKSYGLKTFPHRNTMRKIISALREGEGIGMMLDQNARRDEAVVVDFFGRPAPTNYGLALIAIKTGASVVPAFAVRVGDGKHKIIYEKAISLEKSGDLKRDITDATVKFNNAIENYVRKYPEQWFWVHDRWRVQRKKGGVKEADEGQKDSDFS